MSDITVIGGIKGRIIANAFEQMMAAQENPGTITASYTGTGRNIAENLGRLGADAAMVGAAGDDFTGKGAKAGLEQIGVDVQNLTLVEDQNTAMNLQVLNIIGDLEFAVDNTDAYKCMTKELAEKAMDAIQASKIVCVDGTLEPEVLQYLVENVKAPLFFDPHTDEAAKKAKDFIGSFDTVKPNRSEASAICGMEIFSEEQLKEAAQWFADQGVRRTFITLSGGGVYYKEGDTEGIIRPDQVLAFINEEGAGDAFSAAILDGTVKGMDVDQLAAYGMKAAAIALECKKSAVNPLISPERMK